MPCSDGGWRSERMAAEGSGAEPPRARAPSTCCRRPAAPPSAASASSSPRSSAAGRRSSACATRRLLARIDPLSGRQEKPRRPHPGRRRRACADDAACRADDRRAGQRLLRLSGGRADLVPPGHPPAPARRPQRPPPSRRSRPSSANRCAKSPIPELRACLESLAALAASNGAPVASDDGDPSRSRDQSEENE